MSLYCNVTVMYCQCTGDDVIPSLTSLSLAQSMYGCSTRCMVVWMAHTVRLIDDVWLIYDEYGCNTMCLWLLYDVHGRYRMFMAAI